MVSRRLTQHGVATAPGDGCAAIRVQVARGAGVILLDIEDPYGRRSRRQVSNAEAASTIIETWLRPALDAPPPPVEAAVAVAPVGPAIGVGMVAESAVASDRSRWLGASAVIGARLGRIYLGPLGRFAANDPSAQTTRRTYDVLLAAARPVPLGRVLLTPGVGLGFGWLTEIHSNQPGDQQGNPSGNHKGFRGEASVAAALPLWRLLALTVSFAGTWAPGSRAATSEEDDASRPAPWGYLRGGLGLRWGAP